MWRHRLIRWLAQGDLVVLNADISNDGTIRSRNAGPIYLGNLKIWQWDKNCALYFGPNHKVSSRIHIEPYSKQGVIADNIIMDCKNPITGGTD